MTHKIIGVAGIAISILLALQYLFLIVPWVQCFWWGFRKRPFGVTLTGKTDFISVFFTVFNVSMIIGSSLLLYRSDRIDEFGDLHNYWVYTLLDYAVLASVVYVPLAIAVVIKNLKREKPVESGGAKQMPVKSACWLVSTIPFIALFVIAVWLSRPDYTLAGLCEGRACRCKDGKWGYVDHRDKEAIPYMYDYASDFSDGRACVGIGARENRRYGYIDRDGNVVIPLVYDEPVTFIGDVAYVTKGGKQGTIDKDGNELIPIIYDYVGCRFVENEGLFLVRQGENRGFVRCNGDVVIPIVYEDAESFFSSGLVRVKLYGKWGYLDRRGDVVIPMVYDDAGNFKNGRAEVMSDGERFYIDVKGDRYQD